LKSRNLHSWNVSIKEAIAIQQRLSNRIITVDLPRKINYVAGVDAGFENDGKITRAAVVVLKFPTLELEEIAIARLPTSFPYVPGLLSFRELPAVLKAFSKLKQQPEMILCDGQGIAHPRRMGIASHLGLLTDLPSIGVGKSRLIGSHAAVRDVKGAWVPLLYQDDVIGAVLRTRKGVKPIYVSIGHKVSLETAIKFVLACTTRFKLPETTRLAHKHASIKD